MKNFIILPLVLATSMALTACGNDSNSNNNPSNPDPKPTDPTPTQKTSLSGKVINKDTLEPIPNVTIKANGKTTTTNAQGNYTLTDIAVGPTVITLSANGFISQSISHTLQTTANSLDFRLMSADASVRVATNQNITVTSGNAQLVIPANSLTRKDGQPIQGMANVQIAVIESAQEPENMPGGYRIANNGGWMESFGAMIMSARDDSGAELNLSNGQKAKIVIPLSTRGIAEPTMPLFYYDAASGGWVQSGMATLITTATGQQVYQGMIDRLTPWNADKVMQTSTLKGCVQDTDGKRVTNALIEADGINYSGITTASSDTNGNFTIPVRQSSSLYVMAQSGNKSSNAEKVLSNSTTLTMPQCLVVSTQNNSMTMKLTWGEYPRDVDSHLLTPNGEHIYYANKGNLISNPAANLDVDDTTSFGPEVTTIRRLQVGTYHYGIYNYSGTTTPTNMKTSPIRVEVQGAKIESRIITPSQDDGNNGFWHAFDVIVDNNCNITYRPINKWLADDYDFTALRAPYSPTPKYCTAQ